MSGAGLVLLPLLFWCKVVHSEIPLLFPFFFVPCTFCSECLYKHEISSQILGGMVEKKEGERDLWFCWVWGFKGDSINKTTKSDYLSLPPLRFSEGREGKPISSAGSLAFTDIVSLSSCLVILE